VSVGIGDNARMDAQERELSSYLRRVGDRWPLEAAFHRRRNPDEEHLVVIVSQAFDGMPWLERTTTARNLWDASVMGGGVDVHCYTPAELERKRATVRPLAAAIEKGREIPLR
jgi:uncharacterized protein